MRDSFEGEDEGEASLVVRFLSSRAATRCTEQTTMGRWALVQLILVPVTSDFVRNCKLRSGVWVKARTSEAASRAVASDWARRGAPKTKTSSTGIRSGVVLLTRGVSI